MLTNRLLVRERQVWEGELKVNIDVRMNLVVNEEKYNIWFARTTQEIIKFQIFFNSFKGEFRDLRTMVRAVMKKEKDILSFDWPDERTYDQWKTEHSMVIERVHVATKDKLIDWVEEEQPNNKGT